MSRDNEGTLAIQLESHQALASVLNFECEPTLVADRRTGDFDVPLFACCDTAGWQVGHAARQRWLDDSTAKYESDLLRRMARTAERDRPGCSAPTDLMSLVLRRLVDQAGAYQGENPSTCMFAVPHWFGETARRSLIQAADKAGLRCRSIFNRAIAATKFHAGGDEPRRPVLVMDFARESLVASLVTGRGERLSVARMACDEQHGSLRLMGQLATNLPQVVRRDGEPRVRLAAAWSIERALKSFARTSPQPLHGWFVADRHIFSLSFGRQHVEALARPMVEQGLLMACKLMGSPLADWKRQIEGLVLLGDATLVSLSRETLSAASLRTPIWSASPEAASAHGAALSASDSHRATQKRLPALRSVTGHSTSITIPLSMRPSLLCLRKLPTSHRPNGGCGAVRIFHCSMLPGRHV